jgi:hypothetical protein
MPEELGVMHICETFHIPASEFDAHPLRYQLWYAMRSQEQTARHVKDNGTQDIDDAWWKAYEEFIPSGSSDDSIKIIKQLKAGTFGKPKEPIPIE